MAEENAGQNRGGFTAREALFYHETIRPGKLEIVATKPMTSQRDLSLAYSPGVAVPVEAIAADPSLAASVRSTEKLINQKELELDDHCTRILARRQPAGGDLRLIVAISKAITARHTRRAALLAVRDAGSGGDGASETGS
jgi:malic enzyme